jgi:outer membrane protein TolC
MRSVSHNPTGRHASLSAARHALLRRTAPALLFVALATPLLGAAPQALDLRTALLQARSDNPYARIQELRVREAELAVEGVQAMRILPVLRWQQSFGLVPEARGDVFFSPDSRNDLDNLGPYYRTTIALLQPVYTFGRIKHGLEATRLAGDATEAEREQALEALSEEVIRAYWGLTAARHLVELAGEAEEGYATLVQEVETRAAEDDSLVDDVDVMEVRSFGYAVVRFTEEARAREATATSALLALLARATDEQLTLAPEAGPDWTLDDADLESLHRLAERCDGVLVALRC